MQAVAVIASGLAATIAVLLLFKLIAAAPHLRRKKTNYGKYSQQASDSLDRWVKLTEERISKADIKIDGKMYLLLLTALAVGSFILGVKLFRNVTAAFFLAVSMFLIPDQILHALAQSRKKKFSNQISVAIRLFASEFIYTSQVEMALGVVAQNVPNPVGDIFARAQRDMLIGRDNDIVLANMMSEMETEHGKMFVTLLKQAQKDQSTATLFSELATKIEIQRELERKNDANLAGERIISYVMVAIPIPIYLFMSSKVPETVTFVTETFIGRLAIVGVFLSVLIWCFLDRVIGGVGD